jgi:hypothetical protein
MSYRNIMFAVNKTSREVNHKWRKFQKSKLPTVVYTKPKMKLVPVVD